jgi:hypothetical protein
MPELNPLIKFAPKSELEIYPAPAGQRLRIGSRNAREGEMEEYLGSLVRSPSGIYLELECGSGSDYVLISGNNGIRADRGYRVGSNTGKTMNVTFRDASGNIMRLWADGVDRGQVALQIAGGIIFGP